MAELRELFEMTTKQMEPDQDSWRKQEERHHRADRRRKFGALAVAAAIGVAALVVVIQARDENTGTQSGSQPSGGSTIPTAEPISALPAGGIVDPGRYLFPSWDPAFDATHRITIDVVDGYESADGGVVDKAVQGGGGHVIVLAVNEVWADACRWKGSLLDRSAIASTDAMVAALASQEGLRVSTPTAVTVDGLEGTFMERRVPAQIDTGSACDQGEVSLYSAPEFHRTMHGELQLLWIVDVDGTPLVIDVQLDEGASAQVRAELEQMAESIQIEPVN